MAIHSLNDGWLLREAPLSWGKEYMVRALKGEVLACALPTDVRLTLIAAGRIEDPVVADNFRRSLWVEQRSWWFEKCFDWPEGSHDLVELTLDRLDWGADIFLNGEHIGRHDSVFIPFVCKVNHILKPEGNQLVVRLTCGLEGINDADLATLDMQICTEAGNGCPERGDMRRAFLRKPQYVFGWDWGPRIATCGIGSASIQAHDRVAVRDVMFSTTSISGGTARVRVNATVDSLLPVATQDGTVEVNLSMLGQVAAAETRCDVLLLSGVNYIDFELDVPNAALWQPNGYGEQPLYDLEVKASAGGRQSSRRKTVGIRTVELDITRLDAENRRFALKVNGLPVMCKGGNWIPSDSIYARVSDEKYRTLISEAREANFTMLRIWGGGLYENDIFYELCDRAGILVWQDFMFGCSLIPDQREDFRVLVQREMEYQATRLGIHACLGLLCGNNENQWIYRNWFEKKDIGGLAIYNQIAPQAVHRSCPHVPYWPSSPYGGVDPNDNGVGDRHHWNDCMMNPDMDKRITPEEYDRVTSSFVSEYGYPGPCTKESIAQYFGGDAIDRNSEVWDLHNNTFEKHTVAAGIARHYVDAAGLSLEDYLLYASQVQALMLGYSLEAIRNGPECWGSLFWMYNDCWGETGWTIVDYYLRRKPSYYAVKRAFAPVKLILRERDGVAAVTAHNDTGDTVELDINYGFMSLDGAVCNSATTHVSLPPHSKTAALTFAVTLRPGLWFARADGVDAAILRQQAYRALQVPPCTLIVSNIEERGGDLWFDISAEGYAHAVHFDFGSDVRLSDEYFDLLGGERRRIRAYGSAGKAVQAKAINQ